MSLSQPCATLSSAGPLTGALWARPVRLLLCALLLGAGTTACGSSAKPVRTNERPTTGDAGTGLGDASQDPDSGRLDDAGPQPDATPAPTLTSIAITPDPIVLRMGTPLLVSARALDQRGQPMDGVDVRLSVADTAVAQITPTGTLLAQALGRTELIAVATSPTEERSLEARATLQVTGKPVASAEILPNRRSLEVGQSLGLTLVLRDAGRALIEDPRAVVWSVDEPLVASVSAEGLVTALAPGEAVVEARVEGLAATASIEVTPQEVAGPGSVAIVQSTARLVRGESARFEARVLDTRGALMPQEPVEWSSSEASVASIGADGLVQTLATGRTEICARAGLLEDCRPLEVFFAFDAVASGGQHSCALMEGRLWCWGANGSGQLGLGRRSMMEVPTRLATDLRFESISLGEAHSCAIATGGQAYCWGSGLNGRLGNGSTLLSELEPAPVGGGLRFRAIAAAKEHTCALDTLGALYCWGNNESLQLGLGSTMTQDHSTPQAVVTSQRFVAVAAGANHTCAIAENSEGYCWGTGVRGQLGTGRITQATSPLRVPGGFMFAALTAGGQSTCGLGSGGTVSCWGANDYGQLGEASINDRNTPIFISLIDLGPTVSINQISLGSTHACGTGRGTAYCWGDGSHGRLGTGSTLSRTTAQPVLSTETFVEVAAGGAHTCALTAIGMIHCWGQGAEGQLGQVSSMVLSSTTPLAVENF